MKSNITERRMRIALRASRRQARRQDNDELVQLFSEALADDDLIAEATDFASARCSASGDGATFWETLLAWIMSPEFIEFIKMIIGLFSDDT